MFAPTFQIKTSSSICTYKGAWLLVLQSNMLTRKETVQIIKKKQYKLFIFQLIAMEFDWLHYYSKSSDKHPRCLMVLGEAFLGEWHL